MIAHLVLKLHAKNVYEKERQIFFIEILIFAEKTSLVMFQYRVGTFMQYENSDGWCILLKVQKIHATDVPE